MTRRVRAGIEVVSIDPSEAHRQAIHAACRTLGSSAIASTSSAAPTPCWMLCAASVNAEARARRLPVGTQ